jgi:hypothetical protein
VDHAAQFDDKRKTSPGFETETTGLGNFTFRKTAPQVMHGRRQFVA